LENSSNTGRFFPTFINAMKKGTKLGQILPKTLMKVHGM
jgi:hypothetical protein